MTNPLQWIDIAAISPLFILFIAALLVILIESFAENISKKYAFGVTVTALLCALYAAFRAPISVNPLLTPWITFDFITHFFTVFFILTGLAATFLSAPFFNRFKVSQGEYYFLLLSALFGLILIAASADFLTLFIGIETLSLSLYVLCGYMKGWKLSNESAIKYFFMGAIAAAFLVYGIALIYGASGTTRLDALLPTYQNFASSTDRTLFLSGIALITLGLAFKAAIVPFHVWAPDVYDGAPNPVTAFMAVGTKAGAFVALLRVFLIALPAFDLVWNQGIAWLAAITLIYANFVALRQTQLRRFFAYSGIAQAGFLLIPFVTGNPEAITALLFYLVIYACATFGCFAVLAFMDQRCEGVLLNDLKGLFQRSPLLAIILSICLLTLAGVPPLAGFFAKFYVFKIAFQAGYYWLVIIGLLTTILSAFYYLRIIAIMWAHEPTKEESLFPSWTALTVGVVACLLILLLSIHPESLLTLLPNS
jgi:NADH-quinone oxidoreductase subunit N